MICDYFDLLYWELELFSILEKGITYHLLSRITITLKSSLSGTVKILVKISCRSFVKIFNQIVNNV